MLNLRSVLFTRTVLFITIVVASSLVSCVNVEDEFGKKWVMLEDLPDGETKPVFGLNFANQFAMFDSRLRVRGVIREQEPPFPHTVTWDVLLFDASSSLVEMRTIPTNVNQETGRFQTDVDWNAVTVPAGGFAVLKATPWGGDVIQGAVIDLRIRIRPTAF